MRTATQNERVLPAQLRVGDWITEPYTAINGPERRVEGIDLGVATTVLGLRGDDEAVEFVRVNNAQRLTRTRARVTGTRARRRARVWRLLADARDRLFMT